MYDVVCFGSAVLDILVKSPQFKVMKSHQISGGVAMCEVYGGKTDVDKIVMTSGGGATNVGVGLTRLGVRTGSIFKITKDTVGQLVLSKLREEKLDIRLAIVQVKGDSATSVILVSSDGGRSILTYRGAAGQLTSNEINWDDLQAKWFYVSSLGGQMELLEDLFAFAKQKGINIAFNPGRGELAQKARLSKLLSKCAILSLNRLELSGLTDIPYEDEKGLLKAAGKLGAEIVVMTEGGTGARVITSSRVLHASAFKVKSLDDTGAGDAFGAGFMSGIVQHDTLDKCLKRGMANGAAAVEKIGAKAGLLTESQMEKWLTKTLTIIEEPIL